MGPGNQSQPAGLHRFRLPWLGACVASLALAALGMALSGESAPAEAALPPPAKALAGLGLICSGTVPFLRRRVLTPARIAAALPSPDSELALRHLLAGSLVLWTIAEVPAILGFAQILVGGNARTHLLLCGVSMGILAWLMPVRAKIAAQSAAVVAAVRAREARKAPPPR